MARRAGDHTARYWRTCRRKLGEGFELGGKALTATATAANLSPLATKGELHFPNFTVGVILLVGVVTFLIGIHLQAEAKPDE
jgi:hypothetical protein